MPNAARVELGDDDPRESPRLAEGSAALLADLSAASSLEDLMRRVSHAVRELLHADGATFVLRDRDRCYYAEEDAVSPLWKGRRFPMSACISGWCMRHGQPVAIGDIYQDDRIPADAYRPTFVKSLAMAPVGHDAPLAALGAYWAENRQTSPDELQLLGAIADAAALRIAAFGGAAGISSPAPAPARSLPWQASAPKDHGRAPLRGFLRRLRRGALRPDTLEAYGFAVICVALATLAREAVRATGLANLAVFSVYYPSVLIAVLVGGRRAGALAAVLGGLAAYVFFMPPLRGFDPLDAADLVNLSLYAVASLLIILIIDWYQRAVLRLRGEDAEHLTLAREQRHRVKNALQVVQTIVNQSLRDDPERARTINQRVRYALSDVALSDAEAPAGGGLRDLLTAELASYDLTRITLSGEDIAAPLPSRLRRLLSLAAHEFATNAAKYGSLSVSDGRVAVAWRQGEGRVSMTWTETGGPAVKPPQRRGFGSTLIHRLSAAVGGELSIDFRPAGVCAEISLPLELAR